MHDKRDETNDNESLRHFGYAQELVRAMGGFSNFAVSFSIISILTGIITTLSDALGPGGPAALGIGWPLVSVGTLLVALPMAELASAFPTAGALYHWSAMLGGRGWGWFTAVMNLFGQIAVTAAIDFGCAREIAATAGVSDGWAIVILGAILVVHGAINLFSVRAVAWLNDFSTVVHIVGVVALVGLLALVGRDSNTSPSALFQIGATTRSDGNALLGFGNALILGMYTFTGYDASAHLSEETVDPARRSPIGILASVIVSAIFGYALVVALMLAIHDLPHAMHSDHAALTILSESVGPNAGRFGMGLAIVAMWFCGLSSMTSASRTIYAFSRDGGLPGSRVLRHVSPRYKTPSRAIVAAAIAAYGLVLATSRFDSAVFLTVASIATMGLYVSYGTPIALGLAARISGRWQRLGPFSLGRLGPFVAALGTMWCAFVLIICSLPPNGRSGVLLGAFAALAGLFYVAIARRSFSGPKVSLATWQEAEAAPTSAVRPKVPR